MKLHVAKYRWFCADAGALLLCALRYAATARGTKAEYQMRLLLLNILSASILVIQMCTGSLFKVLAV